MPRQRVFYDDYDECESEVPYDNYQAPPEPKQVAVTSEPEENWDEDIECDHLAPSAPKRKAPSDESDENWDSDENEQENYVAPPAPKRMAVSVEENCTKLKK